MLPKPLLQGLACQSHVGMPVSCCQNPCCKGCPCQNLIATFNAVFNAFNLYADHVDLRWQACHAVPSQTEATQHDNKPTNQQTNKPTNKQTNKQTSKQTDKQTSKQTNKQVESERWAYFVSVRKHAFVSFRREAKGELERQHGCCA
jgi:hypothetical protein